MNLFSNRLFVTGVFAGIAYGSAMFGLGYATGRDAYRPRNLICITPLDDNAVRITHYRLDGSMATEDTLTDNDAKTGWAIPGWAAETLGQR